ncbi:unnamed protein product [Ilex paraguariensis]|uniref:Uncharacterized protein n=1 Tax=Ilex paraguariensis TaxID=185542 RepID=A0ABC8RRM0_9AQUA
MPRKDPKKKTSPIPKLPIDIRKVNDLPSELKKIFVEVAKTFSTPKEAWDMAKSAKDDLKEMNIVCNTEHKEFKADKSKVADRDAIINDLKDENATGWAKGCFIFQK